MNPNEYVRPNASVHFYDLYWAPRSLNSEVSLIGTENIVRNGQILLDLPSDGTLQGDQFTWTGGFGLSPILQIEQLTAADTRSTEVFMAGVTLALAAAALIALVQEMRDEWPPWRRQSPNREVKRSERRRQQR